MSESNFPKTEIHVLLWLAIALIGVITLEVSWIANSPYSFFSFLLGAGAISLTALRLTLFLYRELS